MRLGRTLESEAHRFLWSVYDGHCCCLCKRRVNSGGSGAFCVLLFWKSPHLRCLYATKFVVFCIYRYAYCSCNLFYFPVFIHHLLLIWISHQNIKIRNKRKKNSKNLRKYFDSKLTMMKLFPLKCPWNLKKWSGLSSQGLFTIKWKSCAVKRLKADSLLSEMDTGLGSLSIVYEFICAIYI